MSFLGVIDELMYRRQSLGLWLSFFQVSCSPRPETPVLGVGEPTFSAPLSHQCPEQVGA